MERYKHLDRSTVNICFSGRFDPVHPGHIATIIRLTKIYKKVKIVILDYFGRRFPVAAQIAVMDELLEKYNVSIYTNSTHFAQITREEFLEFECQAYAAGNEVVLRHFEEMGIPVHFCERAYNYSSREYKRLD